MSLTTSKPNRVYSDLTPIIANHKHFVNRSVGSVRSGHVNVAYGYLRSAGLYTYYWSRRGNASSTAYNLNVNISEINPSFGTNNRYLGLSLRCLQE